MAMQRNLLEAQIEQERLAAAEVRFKKMLEIAGFLNRTTFSPKEAADLLGIGLATMYREIGDENITATYPRGSIRIDYASLLAYFSRPDDPSRREKLHLRKK